MKRKFITYCYPHFLDGGMKSPDLDHKKYQGTLAEIPDYVILWFLLILSHLPSVPDN